MYEKIIQFQLDLIKYEFIVLNNNIEINMRFFI